MSSSKLLDVRVLLAADRKSVIVRDSVSSFLHRDRYTVHNATLTELLRSPWEESTKALIVPSPGGGGPGELAPHHVNRLQRYCEGGGKILSMHPQLNAAFGFPFPSILTAEANQVVVLRCQRLIESDKSFLESSAPLCSIPSIPTDSPPLWEGANQFTTSTICTAPTDAPIIRALCKADMSSSSSSSSVVLSYADLCPDLSQFISDPTVLQRLKETHPTREKVLWMLLEQLDLQCHHGDNPSHSLSYLLSSSPNSQAFADAVRRSGSQASYSVELVERDDCGGIPVDSCPSESKLCILEDPSEGELAGMLFDRRKYFDELKTKCLGRTLLYTPVIASTQTLFERNARLVFDFPTDFGLVSVAGRQTKGKGRSGNTWLSPEGCLMFSMPLKLTLSSTLNHCISILQHVTATSVVHAVRSQRGYEGFDLRVKWPNDIYYGRQTKLGGILVSCLTLGKDKLTVIGVGVNVTNKYPTLSLSDCINMHNAALSSSSSNQLELISQEHLLAAILNTMEVLLQDLEETLSTRPLEDSLFCKLYYKYWMHNEPYNKVTLDSTGEVVSITGIDKHGYLMVQEESGGCTQLQPDGNSFDLMRGLIKPKKSD